jgi:hypothetical protein
MRNGGNLFFALMYKDSNILEKTVDLLKNNFGSIVSKSPEYDFNFTDYYEKEFGTNLKKTIIILNKKINKNDLAEIKIKITEIEKNNSSDGKRKINIDPGYVNDKEVVLASFKKKDFKEDLGNGVYAHKVLEFDNLAHGKVKEFWHTFRDYREEKVKKFFTSSYF